LIREHRVGQPHHRRYNQGAEQGGQREGPEDREVGPGSPIGDRHSGPGALSTQRALAKPPASGADNEGGCHRAHRTEKPDAGDQQREGEESPNDAHPGACLEGFQPGKCAGLHAVHGVEKQKKAPQPKLVGQLRCIQRFRREPWRDGKENEGHRAAGDQSHLNHQPHNMTGASWIGDPAFSHELGCGEPQPQTSQHAECPDGARHHSKFAEGYLAEQAGGDNGREHRQALRGAHSYEGPPGAPHKAGAQGKRCAWG
jgi:hypothetical protein